MLNLSRLAHFYQGGVSIEYLEAADPDRVSELTRHNMRIFEEMDRNG